MVDVIILQESRHTWGMGFAQEKPMYFRQLHQKHFAKVGRHSSGRWSTRRNTLPDRSPCPAPVQYLDKIRYQEYNFSAVTHCTPEYVGGIPTTVSKECRWHQQWHARNSLELGAVSAHPPRCVVNPPTASPLQLRPKTLRACERNADTKTR